MSKGHLLFFSLLVSVFLMACHSARPVAKGNKTQTPAKTAEKKEVKIDAGTQRQLKEASDRVFEDFAKKNGQGLNQNTLNYIGDFKFIAIKKMLEYEIPASITLAQGILESGSGRSELTKNTANHFGIKCHKGWEGKTYYYDDDEAQECFRKYSHPEESFNDHSYFLTSRSRYAPLFELESDDYKAWAHGLKDAGYATDKKYPQKLIKYIDDYQLYLYDDLVTESRNKKGKKPTKKLADQPVIESSIVAVTPQKYVFVSKGDTLYSIAKSNNMTIEEIKTLNELTSNEISIGQRLKLSK